MSSVNVRGFTQHRIDDKTLLAAIINRFESLLDHPSTNKTHHFSGRFENIYPDKNRFPEMDQLTQIVMQILQQQGYDRQTLRLGYWFNLMEPGHTTSLHTHEENEELLSGVCYLQVPRNSGDLILVDQGEEQRITPKAGDLFLFPPNLPHAVAKNRSTESRLSVAFNIGPHH